jgi:hypothetical protein
MFKLYILYLRICHSRAKLGGFLNVIAALSISLYLLVTSAYARKIDIIVDLKHGELSAFDPIVLLCLVMNIIALGSHLLFRLNSPGYLQ